MIGVVGGDRRERALEHDQRPEEGAPLGGERDPEVEEQPEHGVEHRRVGAGTGRQVLGHEPGEGALEVGDVDTSAQARDLEHRLRDGVGVAAAHTGHELAERGLLHGIEPARSAEVDQREPTVAQQHDVAGMRVGVEHTVLQHLLEKRPEEHVGDLRALDGPRIAPRDIAHARAVEPLHHEHPRGAQVLVDLGNRDARPAREARRDGCARCAPRCGSRALRAGAS